MALGLRGATLDRSMFVMFIGKAYSEFHIDGFINARYSEASDNIWVDQMNDHVRSGVKRLLYFFEPLLGIVRPPPMAEEVG